MLPEEILHELRRGLPPTGFDEPTQEGLADALRASIASTPHPFVSIAPELFEPGIIPPVCTDHALWGFCEAWEAGHEFDWEPVLELCERVSRTSETATEDGEPPDIAPGYWMTTYASARSAVADLLESAVVQDERAVPPALLNRVRDILLVLADDVNPSAQYERKWRSDRPSGVLDLALNVIRGKAVEALVRYALHVARTRPTKRESGGFSSSGSRLESKIKEKLTDKLDKEVDPSLAVHSLFGKYLPSLYYLDEDWTLAHLDDIFPRQSAMLEYWEAAWDGYLFGGQFFGYLYDLLKPYYRFAIEQLALGAKGHAGSEFSRRRLGQHLAALYWRGVETLADDDSLLHLFLDSAPDEVRAAFVDSLGSALAEVEPSANSQEWQRVETLWRARFRFANHTIQQTGHLGNLHAELAAFARWVPSIPEALDDLYPEIRLSLRLADNSLAARVVEFLAHTVNENLGIAVALLEEVVEQDRGPWFLIAQRDQVYDILSSAMKSEDLEIQSAAVRVINLFGERGNEHYRELLDLSLSTQQSDC
jgi:hypothetical protein